MVSDATDAPTETRALPNGWFELQPTSRVAGRRRACLVLAGIWNLLGAAAWGHSFLMANPPYKNLALIATSIFVAVGVVPVALAVYYTMLLRNVGDARLCVNAPSLTPSQSFKARVDQPVHQNLHFEELTIGLVCEETTQTRSGGKTRSSTRTIYEDRLPVLPDSYSRAGQNITAVATLPVPADQPATSPATAGYPRHAWHIEVKTRIAGSPDYRAKFPVTVAAA
jgi:hypothetical protein